MVVYISKMSDRMDKEAMEKFYNYMKSYYPPGYPVRSPYYPVPEEKERKPEYPQMYGYPHYNPYQMPPLGYPQHYEHEERPEDKPKHEMPNPYAYYPYSPYPYYNPYAYPPYYYAQRDYPKTAPLAHQLPQPHQPHTQPQMHSLYSPNQPEPAPKVASKPVQKAVKQEIVISSDSDQPYEGPPQPQPQPVAIPHPPAPSAPSPYLFKPILPIVRSEPMLEQKPEKAEKSQRKEEKSERREEQEDDLQRDPFLIHKKPKIAKEERENVKTRTKTFRNAVMERERARQANTRYAGMQPEEYQEMIKKQTRLRLEMFYERERARKEQERIRDREIKVEKNEEKKGSADDPSDKDKKDKTIGANPAQRVGVPVAVSEADAKRERIKDDHPLKELRYNESHGRIRLGAYFQSNIPTLMRHEDLAVRRLELQQRLREREVSAITF